MSNKKHKHNNSNKASIKVVDDGPKLWCDECQKEERDCRGRCKTKK